MAHFAKLNDNNIVLEVHCVSNEVLDPMNEEKSGIAFLVDWSGGHQHWKQTSYNNNFRVRYAGIGYRYDELRDAFIAPQPFMSWVFNEETLDWQAPVAYPDDEKLYYWNELTKEWIINEQQS